MSENAPSELTDHVIVYHPIIIIHPELMSLRLESRCVNTYRKYKLTSIHCQPRQLIQRDQTTIGTVLQTHWACVTFNRNWQLNKCYPLNRLKKKHAWNIYFWFYLHAIWDVNQSCFQKKQIKRKCLRIESLTYQKKRTILKCQEDSTLTSSIEGWLRKKLLWRTIARGCN